MSHSITRELAGRELIIETGKLANQADGSVTVRYGDTVLLVTACISPTAREGVDFLPLTVDYEERMYAIGKIPGSFFRREGRPSQEGTLTARLTDRCLRPLFPKALHNEIQVIVTILSVDQENDPSVLSILGASAALSISNIPFDGPVAATRMGYINNQLVINPTYDQLLESTLDLVVAGSKDAVVMIEAGSDEVSEEVILEAVRLGQNTNADLIDMQQELVAISGKNKMEMASASDVDSGDALLDQAKNLFKDRLTPILFSGVEKGERDGSLELAKQELEAYVGESFTSQQISASFDTLVKSEVRSGILNQGKRPDGRTFTDIRPINCDVSILPRTHGTGLFSRGQTQIMTIATLGSMSDQQRLDTLSPGDTKRFMHHYNFPPYSVGEVRRVGGPGRREVGHGALAERAVLPVIPSAEEFPYTIRLVSEAISSNGSTSMASVCGSTLALLDAGVPIKGLVAGVAMGLVMGEDGKYAILTDILGVEAALGDMDFKVAGTDQGINALQMDIKVKGITYQIMEEALAQALEARKFVLGKIRETIENPRSELSPYAPRIIQISIPIDKIGTLIGPGGKTIRSIIEETKATIDVDNDGTVTISSTDSEAADKAIGRVESLTRDIEIGAVYTGKVTRIMNFGAFVELVPGKDALVHISELSDERVPSVEDVVDVGQELTVLVTEIDNMGRVNASRRALLRSESGSSDGEEGGDSERPGTRDNRPRGGRPSGGRPQGQGSGGRGQFRGR